MQATLKGLLGPEKLHARIEDLKRTKGAPPWSEKLVVNDQIVGTLICQPPGHPTDRHYHLVDEWWVVLEGEIDWEIEGQTEPVRARAGDLVFAPANHFHHIRPKGTGPTIRLAITPPGEFHRHDRAPGAGPSESAQGASMSYQRLSIPVGEAMFTQRSIRKFKPDPIPMEDLHLIIDAASKAPNGGNRQVARFLLVTDRKKIHDEFGPLYREAWWAKRRDEGHKWTTREGIPPGEKNHRAAAQLADEMKDAPCVVFALAMPPGPPNSVIPACQNLMLAARALGIGSLPTTLHPSVMDRFRMMFDIPADVTFHFCIPLGYPRGSFGVNVRKPTSETTFLGRWGAPVPW